MPVAMARIKMGTAIPLQYFLNCNLRFMVAVSIDTLKIVRPSAAGQSILMLFFVDPGGGEPELAARADGRPKLLWGGLSGRLRFA
jgi:hypothetical protein